MAVPPSSALNGITSWLDKAEEDILYLHKRFQTEFQDRFATSPANPLDLLQRLRALEREIKGLQRDFDSLVMLKQDLLERAGRGILENSEMIDRLGASVGYSNQGEKGTGATFKQAVTAWKENLAKPIVAVNGL